MSFVHDQIRRFDNELDRIQLSSLPSLAARGSDVSLHATSQSSATASRTAQLQALIGFLSASSLSTHSLTPAHALSKILRNAPISDDCPTCQTYSAEFEGEAASEDAPESTQEHELEWLLVGKATIHTYGLVLDTLIQQTLPINDELWFWTSTHSSYRQLSLYSVQTSPMRLWSWSKSIYHEVRERNDVVVAGWKQFYSLVKKTIHDRSTHDMQKQILSPLAAVRSEIRHKQKALEKAKLINASGIGLLLGNGIGGESLASENAVSDLQADQSKPSHQWKGSVVRTISFMDAILYAGTEATLADEDLQNVVLSYTVDDDLAAYHTPFSNHSQPSDNLKILLRPYEAVQRLQHILDNGLPAFTSHAARILKSNRRPSRIVQYWLPAVILLLSSSTILRIVVNRKAEIVQWVQDFGSTVMDFWANWVVEPARKIIGTIRHDESSEVSIMSKRSLEGDRESLERMVVDFAIDNPEGPQLTETQIADIQAKVREGDLTSVLMAYEKDLKSPLYGSVRGNLIRALLIQIQKTKVDVEIAMGGIDALLKSQELVFGFVGLTPGILVCVALVRWFQSLGASRKSTARGQKQSHSLQILRNVDRILTGSPQSDTGVLSYQEHGLLVCEAIVLREIASRTFPKQVFLEFLQDFNDLIDNSSGVGRQIRVADRIRWAYSRWL